MGLLSWRRSARGPDRAREGPAVPAAPPAASDPPRESGSPEPDVIRAATLTDLPDWAKLPPIPPLLSEMPWVVSQHFDESLVSWQVPERFLGPLGHSVSPSAPSGIVEGMAVLAGGPAAGAAPPAESAGPTAADQPGPADQPLTLAVPPAAAAGEAGPGRPTIVSRTLRLPSPPATPDFEAPEGTGPADGEAGPPAGQPAAGQPAWPAALPAEPAALPAGPADVMAAGGPDEPSSPSAAAGGGFPEAGPDEPDPAPDDGGQASSLSDLVGAVPLGPDPRPLVLLQPAAQAAHGLVHAPTPPDLPLAHLPSARLPAEGPGQPTAAPAPIESAAPAREIGAAAFEPWGPERQATGPASVPSAPSSSAAPAAQRRISDRGADQGAPPGATAPSPAGPGGPGADLPLAVGPAEESLRSAPLVGEGRPMVADGPASPPAPSVPEPGPVGAAPSGPLPLAPPAAPSSGPEPAGSPEAGSGPDQPGPGREASSAEFEPDPAPAPGGSAREDPPVAPLLGQAPPLTVEPAALGLGSGADDPRARGGEAPGPPPLAAGTDAPPRVGLGEPMTALPPTAASWDITTMTRAQQLQASRALIQRQTASIRGGGPAGPPGVPPARLPGPAALTGTARPPVPETVLAGSPLARARLEPDGPALAGVTSAELPPATPAEAPLLSMDPLLGAETTPAGGLGPAGPLEGMRARSLIGQQHGLDLTDVPVDRSVPGAAEARQAGARAYTSDRGVVIPAGAGSLESGPGEALLAHELTHVVQRARLGPHLPDGRTPAGRRLEAEARSAEMGFRAGVPLPLAAFEPATPPDPRIASGGTGADALPLAATASSSPDPDALAVSILDRMSALSPPAPAGGMTAVFPPSAAPALAPSWPAAPPALPAPTGAAIQRAEDLAPAAAPPMPPPAAAPEDPAHGPAGRPSDEELSNLSRWLYPLIRYRLKGELREDRERAGLLTDHYRRW